jgi:hypothetical protein
MTKGNEKRKTDELPDDKNPIYLFSNTHADLLVQIVGNKIDSRKLALEQLRNRGLDEEGRWVGFRQR